MEKLQNNLHHFSYRTNEEKGLAIGLKLCRHLLKKINGKLEIERESGKGTIMKITLQETKSD